MKLLVLTIGAFVGLAVPNLYVDAHEETVEPPIVEEVAPELAAPEKPEEEPIGGKAPEEPEPEPTPPAQPVVKDTSVKGQAKAELERLGLADSWYAVDYIFHKESTWRPAVVNGINCKGLGQSCPNGSGLVADCPNWANDVACQVRHFTDYANERYGSWHAAYTAWNNQTDSHGNNWW